MHLYPFSSLMRLHRVIAFTVIGILDKTKAQLRGDLDAVFADCWWFEHSSQSMIAYLPQVLRTLSEAQK